MNNTQYNRLHSVAGTLVLSSKFTGKTTKKNENNLSKTVKINRKYIRMTYESSTISAQYKKHNKFTFLGQLHTDPVRTFVRSLTREITEKQCIKPKT